MGRGGGWNRVGVYSRLGTSINFFCLYDLRWALIQGWALIQITVSNSTLPPSVNAKGSNTWSMPRNVEASI